LKRLKYVNKCIEYTVIGVVSLFCNNLMMR
jgi:hypothetical protein